MDESIESLLNFVPINLRGVDVLLVHDDKVTLTYLSSLLEQYSFKVTVSDIAAEAVSIICNEDGKFKLVMAKANMLGMDIIYFLDLLLQRDILLICTYSGGCNDVAKEALIGGVVFILQEPIHLQDLKYVWQHVYYTRENLEKANPNTNCNDKVDEAKERKRILDDIEDNPIEKITKFTLNHVNFNNNDQHIDHKKGQEKSEHGNNESASEEENKTRKKKRARVWTPELHQRFIEALSELGRRRNPKAKEVLDKMNVPYLTVSQVSSHMQRYKHKMQHGQDSIIAAMDISSNINGRIEFPEPLPDSKLRTTGVIALPTSLIQNHNQSQFTVDVGNPSHCQETPHNETSKYGLSTGFSNHEGSDINAIIRNHLPIASRIQNHSLLQPLDNMRNSNFTNEASRFSTTGLANFRSQSLDAMAQNRLQTNLVSQNQSLQLQQNHGNAIYPYGYATGMANYGCKNIDALVRNPMPTASVNQSQSLIQQRVPLGNVAIPYEPLTRFNDYGCQKVDSATTLVNQNQSSLQYKQNNDNAPFPYEFSTRLVNYGNQNLDTAVKNMVPDASMNYNNQSFQLQGIQDNEIFHYELPMGLANYRPQNMDVVQNNMPATIVNENKYPFQLQTTQGNGTFSRDLSTRLASFGSKSLDIFSQNIVPATSMIPNESQGIANFSPEFSIGLTNHESQNIEVGLQKCVPTRSANYRSQNLDAGRNNPVTIALTDQNQLHGADHFEWVKKFLLEDN